MFQVPALDDPSRPELGYFQDAKTQQSTQDLYVVLSQSWSALAYLPWCSVHYERAACIDNRSYFLLDLIPEAPFMKYWFLQ
jgi:hypothetical protein